MRILRGQSNLEVSSKGFAWFVVGLVLATFLGGALRTVLNSSQLHQRIVSELKNRFPKHEFEIGATEVLLSRGIWPGLGLRVRDLTFKQDVCGKLSFVLTIPQATLPLDLLGVLHGRIRLNDIEIEGGGLHLDYRDCAPKPIAATVNATGNNQAAPNPPRPILAPKVNWKEAARFADGIELKNFAVTYEKSPTWKLVFNTAYLSLGEEAVAQARVDVEKSLPFGTLTHPVEFDLRGDENVMQWNFNADFKEGHVHLNGSLDVNNQAGLVKMNFRQVPIRDLMGEAYQMGFVDRELKLKATWLSCSLKWEGQLQSYAANPVDIRDCRVEGGYGRADLEQADLWLNGQDYFKVPAHIKVTQLQVLPMVEALDRQVLPAVLPKLGVWSGVLDFANGSSWSLDGHLSASEIIFSSQSMMGKQVVDSLHTDVKRAGAKIAAKIDDVHFHEGEFNGSVQFDLSSDWRDGTFRAQIDSFILSPSIQKLLVGGSIGALKAQGQGALSAGELSQWSGSFSLPEIKGEGWHAENIQVQSKFQGGSFHIEGLAKSAAADSAWRIYPQLRSVRTAAPEQVSWRDLNGKFEINKNGGTVHSATAYELPGGHPWKGKGVWVRDGEFNGTLSVSGG
ncbi:MAG: hypothetical protein ACXVA9_06865, partial [Bdellovibrionales bacterium]